MKRTHSIKVGISSCLLGNEVRYDGRHSRNTCILDSMSDLVELLPFCPEVAIGMSIPRPPINLVRIEGEIRVRGVHDKTHDVTDALNKYAMSLAEQFEDISGYIFKSRSPSCGLDDVDVYDGDTQQVIDTSSGQFAKIIAQQHPSLPIENELRLENETIRNDFIKRVQVYSAR